MSGVVASLPEEMRAIFAEVIGQADPALLQTLYGKDEPSIDEREGVLRLLSAEFSRCLQSDDEPTERGLSSMTRSERSSCAGRSTGTGDALRRTDR